MLLPFWFPENSFSSVMAIFFRTKMGEALLRSPLLCRQHHCVAVFLGRRGERRRKFLLLLLSSPSLSVVLGHCINSKQSRLSSAKKKHGIIGGCYPMTYPNGGGGGEQRTNGAEGEESPIERFQGGKKNAGGAAALLLYPVL